ncbi:sulfite exporter TauE/SafE family protein [Dissulfurirhabdus thermomarina]|uniref:Probable membrane transporter protein n=1 Tax=Dissulfurirhabdus thermomarina TaxID=1765737 RepID=A0A6N9TK91_DISTH|nr:sulfite exporter TauE/SafE family protein [Dissulfurirhabdus thermomarina]NDY41681.1 sulfite exporter TauE/SafE family protein [Dissulfurirhabdus thermomarina]NMX22751.1 sulfite exporter TauE/SafE family protein [Dissulfurirhabdus thermomarina]
MFRFTFPVSQVTTWVFLPPLVTFVLAFFGAMAGVTGAFLLLPFQVSILGYTGPGVSATNFVYNLFAIPGTVLRYAREGRMNWPLAAVITLGSLPGIGLGYLARVRFLTDPRHFKPFVALVLLYLAWRIGRNLLGAGGRPAAPPAAAARVRTRSLGLRRVVFAFDGRDHAFDPRPLFLVALAVGVVGGAYGIGGGAVLAPFCVTVLELPVHAVAGAALFGTFMSSVVGVAVYSAGFFSGGVETRPDILLGALFGLGGLAGGYLGARMQRFVPERPIKVGLLAVLLFVAGKYLLAALG